MADATCGASCEARLGLSAAAALAGLLAGLLVGLLVGLLFWPLVGAPADAFAAAGCDGGVKDETRNVGACGVGSLLGRGTPVDGRCEVA